MTDHDQTAAENAALRARISALSAASLRISASLDLETVLNEVVESARALTGARYGAIATIDEAGVPQDFVTSGFTQGSHRDDVLRIQGTPSSISRYPASGYEVLWYGLSTVQISLGDGRVMEWDNQGNLKVRLDAGPR